MGETKRETGYFWVIFMKKEWEAAFHSNGSWLLPGYQRVYRDKDFQAIGDRIPYPRVEEYSKSEKAVKR